MNLPTPRLRRGLTGFGALVDRLAVEMFKREGRLVLTKNTVRAVVDAFVRELAAETKRKGRLVVPKLGAFYIRHTKPRRIRNPQTKTMMLLPASWAIALRGSKFQKGVGDGP